ncbi:Hypothetical protein AA314_03651 [Archangium gephyra]|uniref:Uncharacterized protein n=1 Tax=Archangium gephyra TaxID=48 RepID=A0AAC8TDI2_9BACT|nr:Hypothetical protein AA314_03651 [Archangium gephyra]
MHGPSIRGSVQTVNSPGAPRRSSPPSWVELSALNSRGASRQALPSPR